MITCGVAVSRLNSCGSPSDRIRRMWSINVDGSLFVLSARAKKRRCSAAPTFARVCMLRLVVMGSPMAATLKTPLIGRRRA